jgi:predicted nucleic acid-binding protein
MGQVAEHEPLERGERTEPTRPLVFLDTSVILGYIRGDPVAVQLFSAQAAGRIQVAVNPIVLQELLLATDGASRPKFEQIRDHLRVLPLDLAKAEALLPQFRSLRNRLAHSNDVLILSSAFECDFIATNDALLGNLVTAKKPQVVTPDDSLSAFAFPRALK